MNVSLTPELEKLVNQKVKTGMYQTASEVIREGLRLLNERDQRVEGLRRDIDAGFAAVEEGEFNDHSVDGIRALGERIKRRGLKRIASR